MTNEELQSELFKLLDSADKEGLSEDYLVHVMRLFGQIRVLETFLLVFTNDQTKPYVTEALRIMMDWKMKADGFQPGMTNQETRH